MELLEAKLTKVLRIPRSPFMTGSPFESSTSEVLQVGGCHTDQVEVAGEAISDEKAAATHRLSYLSQII